MTGVVEQAHNMNDRSNTTGCWKQMRRLKQSRGTRPEMRSKHVSGVVDGAQGVKLVLHAFLGKCTLLSNSPVCQG